MNVIVFEDEAYYKMRSETRSMIKDVVKEALEELLRERTEIDWIDAEEAKELLGIKSKTVMQRLRSEGLIVFSEIGKIIKYSRKSIMEYLEKNKVSFK
jgi:hypothetical protein